MGAQLIAGTCCFAGANVGNGPGPEVVLFCALLATLWLALLWLLLDRLASATDSVRSNATSRAASASQDGWLLRASLPGLELREIGPQFRAPCSISLIMSGRHLCSRSSPASRNTCCVSAEQASPNISPSIPRLQRFRTSPLRSSTFSGEASFSATRHSRRKSPEQN